MTRRRTHSFVSIEQLEDRLTPAVEITSTFRPLDFTYTGSFAGTVSIPDGWAPGVDYVDSYNGTVSGTGRMVYTNQTTGTSGTITGNGSGTGRDNCGPYGFQFTGTSTISDAAGVLTTDTTGGSDQYTYSNPNACASGGGEIFQQSGLGTFNPQSFAASLSWNNAIFGGTSTGSFSGTVTQQATDKTDLKVTAVPQTATTFGYDLEVTGKLMTTPNHDTAVSTVGLYWAEEPRINKIIRPAMASVPVYWNQGKVEVRGVSLTDLTPRPEGAYLVAVVDAGLGVDEADEENNLVVLGADLAIVQVGDPEQARYSDAKGVYFTYDRFSPSVLLSRITGAATSLKQTASFYVVNRGIFPAAPVDMVFFASELDRYQTSHPSYLALGMHSLPKLDPGEVLSIEVPDLENPIFTTKSNGEPQFDGPYFQGVHLDPQNRVLESKEDNNTDTEDACINSPFIASIVEAGALVLDGLALGQSAAARHLRHYLGGSGAPIVWTPSEALSTRAQDASSVRGLVQTLTFLAQNHTRSELQRGNTVSPLDFTPAELQVGGVYPALRDDTDMFLAVNGTQGATARFETLAVTERIVDGRRYADYTGSITMTLTDNYQFDQGDASDHFLDYVMRYLSHCGQARSFGVTIQIPAFGVTGTVDLGPVSLPPPQTFAPPVPPGRSAQFTVRNPDGSSRFTIQAYAPSFLGGVQTATGDVNGDGVSDIVTGAGPGGGPHVRVFDGANGSELASFFAYDPSFRGGVHVTLVDVDGDGRAEIVTGAGVGGGPHVRLFVGTTGEARGGFFASNATDRFGVTVTGGDVNGDGKADLITGAGAGAGSFVRTFDGRTFSQLGGFSAYATEFRGGVSVLARDLDGDGVAEIVTGAGPGGAPHLRVLRADGTELANTFAFAPDLRTGLDLNLMFAGSSGTGLVVRSRGASEVLRVLDALSLTDRPDLLGFDALVLNAVEV